VTERRLGPALAKLYALAPRGARYGLAALAEAAAKEGNPQLRLPTLHIAGTNGKGSVSATLESMARASGAKVGLYTSPHLVRFAERIRVDGEPIDDEALADRLRYVLDAHPELTFFEVATLAAWLTFAEAKVDLAVMEVGLGGRLDATNLVERPLATAITSIGFDHMELLGDTLAKIAAEKAGIIKPGAPLVVGAVPDEAATVIEAIARERQAACPWWLHREVIVESSTAAGAFVAALPDGRRLRLAPSLFGPHQRGNAAVAAAVAVRAGIGDSAIEAGVRAVQWPGRCELLLSEDLRFRGRFLLDGAHNLEGAEALAAALAERTDATDTPARRALVFGVMADKPWMAMLSALAPHVGPTVFVAPRADGGGRRAADVDAMRAAMPGASSAPSLSEALSLARAAVGEDGLVVVAGSLYLVGEARATLLEIARDPQVGL
jgi:dihydrofolate synthase/folylpolyglutamate synthase